MSETDQTPRESGFLKQIKRLFLHLGPGLITGAADDDPSGIATYSQAGAQFGVNMLWSVVITYPLMTAIQTICARIGRVTGKGLGANMAAIMPRWLVTILVMLLFVANVVNIGADLAAMGAAARLVVGGNEVFYAIVFAILSLIAQVWIPYDSYVHVLKWLTMALFAYVGVLFTVHIDWLAVAEGTVWPKLVWNRDAFTVIVAVFGTTISPYLFFWQTAEEVEDTDLKANDGPLLAFPDEAPAELDRIATDNYVGMGYSNLIAFFIVLTTAVTLNKAGITDIQTSAQAAEALRPIAGEFAFLLFSLGILGTGLLALPVLTGSSAYAIGDVLGWKIGLEQTLSNAKAFYAVIGLGYCLGLLMLVLPIDPIKALFWSAVLNGVIAVPLMVAIMLVVSNRAHLGKFVAPPVLAAFGWLATAVMAAAAIAMLVL